MHNRFTLYEQTTPPPQMNNLLEVVILRGRFLADVQKAARGPFSSGPRLREPRIALHYFI